MPINMAAIDDEDFSCPICIEVLIDPVLLPCCSANYCRECLRALLKSGIISCPSCRGVLHPRLSVDSLPVNRLVAALISKYLPQPARPPPRPADAVSPAWSHLLYSASSRR